MLRYRSDIIKLREIPQEVHNILKLVVSFLSPEALNKE